MTEEFSVIFPYLGFLLSHNHGGFTRGSGGCLNGGADVGLESIPPFVQKLFAE